MSARDHTESDDDAQQWTDNEEEDTEESEMSFSDVTAARNGLDLDQALEEITGEVRRDSNNILRQRVALQRQKEEMESNVALTLRLSGRCSRVKRRGRITWRCKNRKAQGDPLGHCSSCRSTTGASKLFPIRAIRKKTREADKRELRRRYRTLYKKEGITFLSTQDQGPVQVAVRPVSRSRSTGSRGRSRQRANVPKVTPAVVDNSRGTPLGSVNLEDYNLSMIDLPQLTSAALNGQPRFHNSHAKDKDVVSLSEVDLTSIDLSKLRISDEDLLLAEKIDDDVDDDVPMPDAGSKE